MAGKVEFHDRSADTIKAMASLAKKGLRAEGKVLKEQALSNMSDGQKKTVGRLLTAQASVDGKTGQPYLLFGYISRKHDRHAKASKGVKWMPNPSWIEFGTEPHTITAGNKGAKKGITGKKMLSDGVNRFGKTVQHPGYAGKKPATEAGRQKAKEAHDAALPFLKQIATMSDSDLIREAASLYEELDLD